MHTHIYIYIYVYIFISGQPERGGSAVIACKTPRVKGALQLLTNRYG